MLSTRLSHPRVLIASKLSAESAPTTNFPKRYPCFRIISPKSRSCLKTISFLSPGALHPPTCYSLPGVSLGVATKVADWPSISRSLTE